MNKLSSLALSLFAVAALTTGCAEMHNMHSSSMGANAAAPKDATLCNDGTKLPANSKCRLHGGVSDHSSGSAGHAGTTAPKSESSGGSGH